MSYQANKTRPYYRWFKYKEGFSAELVEFLLEREPSQGVMLDPFAGSGAALFAAHEVGWRAQGIELLPVGVSVIEARQAAGRLDHKLFNKEVEAIVTGAWRKQDPESTPFEHLRITTCAFSSETEKELSQYRSYVSRKIVDPDVKAILLFAGMCILENISFTRKDGQYLRWDERSARTLKGKSFNKGSIPTFSTAINSQLRMMQDDLSQQSLFPNTSSSKNDVRVQQGSCLDLLPAYAQEQFDCIITSPPYCNRYDYTRTYALELAFLGIDEAALSQLRQSLLSCTVENKSKLESLRTQYSKLKHAALFDQALKVFENQDALQEVLIVLEDKARKGLLNNPHVVRMIRNYFLESSITVHEMARITRPGARVIMINDNVQYGGEEVPVDLILCEFARAAGFAVEHIWTLGRGKGNSSQQMGAHGRNELRKCAYVWSKK